MRVTQYVNDNAKYFPIYLYLVTLYEQSALSHNFLAILTTLREGRGQGYVYSIQYLFQEGAVACTKKKTKETTLYQ